ncbi:MAG: SH3 domain-containing protein, partial [Micromonosporaceae bacterium]|nr:SH3 domain-containing protein [Micromonosporaceae bacterium]
GTQPAAAQASGTQPAAAQASGTQPAAAQAAASASVDLVSRALHTTGTVGENDRSIVAVFSLHPSGTSFATATATLTTLVKSLPVNGAVPITGTSFGTWGSGVRVRAAATTQSSIVATLPAGATVVVACQTRGELVTIDEYRNDWWAYLPAYGGYMTNIYISSPDNVLPGVPVC